MIASVYVWAYACAALGLVVVMANHAKERAVVGEVLTERRDWGALRFAGLGALAVALLVAWFGREHAPLVWTLPLIGVCAAVQVYRPDFSDQICGSDGVRYGWYLRRLDDLEEWRLTGDHLRFRLFGIWRAVPLPAERHESMRAVLEARAAGRESRFAD